MANLFHPSLNTDVDIKSLSAGSHKKVWWLCENGHEWEAKVYNVNISRNCPVCSNRKIVAGINDLRSSHPLLAAEWHPYKNAFSSDSVSAGSDKKAWWLCENGHEWEAKIYGRKTGNGCPFCANKMIDSKSNSLAALNPQLAAQWHPKNALGADEVSVGSSKSFWWQCDKDHEWQTSVQNRKTRGCPYCSGRKAVTSKNDLVSLHPSLAKELHTVKNEGIIVSELTQFSNRKVWWLGNCGHEWETKVSNRVKNKVGCPFCSNQKLLSGFNDISTVLPHLISEWGKKNTKNIETVSAFSNQKFWWSCEKGHEWKTSPAQRHNYGCPKCGNVKTGIFRSKPNQVGVDDFETVYPNIAKLWHPTKNKGKEPKEFKPKSNYIAWWLCDKGHEWETSINSCGNYVFGCPICSRNSFSSKAEKTILEYVRNLGLKVIANDRKVLKGVELDIYVPDKNFAVEFNGLYWHSDRFVPEKAQKRHYDKWLAAKNAGIQLVQVWEDDWNRNPEFVKRMLAHKLGVSSESKVFARKTIVQPLITEQAQTFLTANHIQGFASGSHYLGLFDKEDAEKLAAVLVLKQEPNNTLNIIRYATAANVVGGFTKLLKYAEKAFTPDKFITFADRIVSDGGLYESNGFVADKEIPPDYMYVVNGVRKHKFGYRLKKFRDDPNLQYVEGMTERELAQLNNLPRIWDAGKIRYVKQVVVVA